MQDQERKVVEIAVLRDIRAKRMFEKHQELEEKLKTLRCRNFLTPLEEIEEKKTKLEKLTIKEELVKISREIVPELAANY